MTFLNANTSPSSRGRSSVEGAPGYASDEEYESARAQFGEEELVRLTMALIGINGWNRLAIAFRPEVGKYQPRAKVE
jgi:alkylhydroperoxidase family enzyme